MIQRETSLILQGSSAQKTCLSSRMNVYLIYSKYLRFLEKVLTQCVSLSALEGSGHLIRKHTARKYSCLAENELNNLPELEEAF